MNTTLAKEYIDKNKDTVLELFIIYQMIETLLFMKLYPQGILSKGNIKEKELTLLNKYLNSKTMGKIIETYRKKYPNDDYKIIGLLETIRKQRNSFMHSFFMLLAFSKQEELYKNGDAILTNFTKEANGLLDKVLVIKEDLL